MSKMHKAMNINGRRGYKNPHPNSIEWGRIKY